MKNTLSLIFSGIIGGLITLGGFHWLSPAVTSNDATAQRVNTVIPTFKKNGIAPINFTKAATLAMPTVVHIKASESRGQAQYRRNEEEMEGGNMFDFFFESPFGGGAPFGGREKKGTGSGVIISEDGYIVTNNHVVDFADELEVTLFDDRTFKATKVGVDPRTDLAVIKIDARDLPSIEFTNSNEAQVGEWVLAVGNPFDLTSTVTAGIISAKGRSIGVIKNSQAEENFIQTDAVVNPGNSGGALVDLEGQLVGINTAIATPTGTFAGYSFAIPSNMVDEITSHIIEFGGPRAMLGITVSNVDESLVREKNLSVDKGVFVGDLTDGGAAQYAGILPNDVIMEVDGTEVTDAPSLIEIVGKARVGDVLQLTINRAGEIKKIRVVLKAG
ncbi:MAG: trypsin-like peptidase domain-containing protein [Bacteroidota bacterium]